MSSPSTSEDTNQLLTSLRRGDPTALDRLVPRLYDELHRLAHRELAHRGGSALRTTELVHEAYLKLVDGKHIEAQDRVRFLALVATTMRHIVIDQARKRRAQKRGGDWQRVSFRDLAQQSPDRLDELIAIDEALRRLGRLDEQLKKVVECRIFAGMTVDETAAVVGISPRSVDRAWQRAKAWLYREIHEA